MNLADFRVNGGFSQTNYEILWVRFEAHKKIFGKSAQGITRSAGRYMRAAYP
jgi:hypothetical protein